MSTGTTPAFSLIATQQRRVPRYKLTIPLNLTVLRSGIPDNIAGRTLEIGEGGMGVVVAAKLLLGESVRVEFLLPHTTSPVRATAVVRYQHGRGFGLQFLRLPLEQQSTIRYWTRCEGEVLLATQSPEGQESQVRAERARADSPSLPTLESYDTTGYEFSRRRIALLAVLVVLVVAIGAWWQWQQEYAALEAQIPTQQSPVLKPQLRVPATEMQRRIKHRAVPEYPEAARGAAVQGPVVLNAVIGPDGNVMQSKFAGGPESLSRAAMEAVRWWRYEPYLVDGQAVTVETTIAVDFH